MHHLGGVRPEDMHAQQTKILGGYQQFEHAVGVAGDLTAGQLPISGDADLVGHRVLGQLDLGRTHVGHLRDGVDSDRLQRPHSGARLAEGVIGRQAALFHRGGCQRREPDDVTDGVDMIDLGLKSLVVDEDSAAIVGFEAGVGQV